MTLTQVEEIGLSTKLREVAMKNASQYRARASLCRQMAVYDPDKSWHLLAEAVRWEHRAETAISDNFQDCNATFLKGQSVDELAA